jgi:signal recognition particle receptor subunit beta
MRFTADNKIYIKILYWGPHLSGKTTILDTLDKLTREKEIDILPIGSLTKIKKPNGTTIYFDRGIFQYTKQSNVFYNLFTVAGSSQFSTIRKKIFKGTDGVIFVFDSQKSRIDDNIDSLKELKEVAKDDIIKKVPLIIMLNKRDSLDPISASEVEQILKNKGLMYEPEHPLYIWNPIIFETIGLYENQKNVYEAFIECTNLIDLYLKEKKPIKDARINLILPEQLKNEWEIFAKEILKTSLSQMIRDAVREYQNKYKNLGNVYVDLESRIEKLIFEKMGKVLEKLKP